MRSNKPTTSRHEVFIIKLLRNRLIIIIPVWRTQELKNYNFQETVTLE